MSETLAAENNVEGSFLKYNTRLQEGLYERHFSKDQLTKSKASAKNVLHTVSYYWTFICYGFAVALVGPTIPVIADATSTPISKMGWVFTMRGLGVILGSMIGTRIYDRLNNRSHRLADLFLIGNIVLFSTVIGLIPSMTSFTSLLSLYLAFGFCAGMINMGCNLMLMFTWESQLAGMIIGLSVAAAIGNILSPLVIAYGLSFTGVYSWASGLLASSAVLMGLCQLLPEPGQYAPLPEEETELLDEQEQLFETLSDSTPQRKEPTSRFQSFLLLATVGVAMFGAIALETSFGGLLSLYLRERALALTSTTNALLNSLFWASMATGRISAVIASKYFSPALLLALSGNGVFAALSLLLALPNQTTAWIATSLMGFSIASMYPMALAFPETSLKGVQISDKLSASLIMMAASSELFIPAITTSAIGKGGANALVWTLMSISVITTVGYAGMFLWSFALKYLPKLVGRSASSDQVPLMQSNLLDSPTNSPVPLSPASEYIEKDPQRIERPATPA